MRGTGEPPRIIVSVNGDSNVIFLWKTGMNLSARSSELGTTTAEPAPTRF